MYGFSAVDPFNLEILETYKFVWAILTFCLCAGLLASVWRGQIGNEFAEAPLEHNMGLVHEVEIFENRKFAGKLKLWHVGGPKIIHGSSLARISLPCGAPRVITSDS